MKTNGASAKVPAIPASAKAPSIPSLSSSAKSGPARSGAGQGAGPAAKALAAAFDVHEDPADSMTAVEAPMFSEEAETRAGPVAAKRTGGRDAVDAAVTVPSLPVP